MTTRRRASYLAVAGLACLAAAPRDEAPSAGPVLVRRIRVADPPTLASLQNKVLRGTVMDVARAIPMGSIFSGLHHSASEPETAFLAVTGHGPTTDETRPDGSRRRVFHVPLYDPPILKVAVQPDAQGGGTFKIAEAIFLRTIDDRLITGLPGGPEHGETLVDPGGRPVVPNPEGMDPRAVAWAGGDFWLGDDYSPSVVRVGPDGRVRVRFLPLGKRFPSSSYATVEALPAALGLRQQGRGLQAIAITREGGTLYGVMRGPVAHPDAATAERSRLVRVVALDIPNAVCKAEYVLALDEASSYGARSASEVGVLDAALLRPDVLLVLEGTAARARVFVVDLSKATNIVASKWDDLAARPTLESLAPEALDKAQVVPAAKTLVLDLNSVVADLPSGLGGLAVVDAHTFVVGNDNGFPIAEAPPSELLYFSVPAPLPLEPIKVPPPPRPARREE